MRLHPRSRRRLLALSLLALSLQLGAAVASGLFLHEHYRQVQVQGSPKREFTVSKSPLKLTQRALHKDAQAATPWPTWGLVPTRTRYAAGVRLRPPYRRLWTVHGHALIELPPVVAYGHLYFGTHAGIFYAAATRSGTISWQRDIGRCMAASPAVAAHVIYVATMGPAPCPRHAEGSVGALLALDAKTGKLLWRYKTGLIETSPLVNGRRIYFASYTSNSAAEVIALDLKTHTPVWQYAVPAKVTSSPALLGRRLFIGSYQSRLYCLNAETGKPFWVAQAPGGLGLQSGFYATPTLAYGRVYIGGIDGRMYSFGYWTGRTLWAVSLGSYVYSSAAVWRDRVYVGSYYNNRFWALDAATGAVRWSFAADGKILGSPTVLDGLVYFSTTNNTTYALDALSGAKAWTFPDGQYTPLVTDSKLVYLVGKGRIYGLAPARQKPTSKQRTTRTAMQSGLLRGSSHSR